MGRANDWAKRAQRWEKIMEIHVFDSISWRQYAESAHLILFNEKRPKEMNRIDFALMATEKEIPLGYITIRELDNESIYWQYGGIFPSIKDTAVAFRVYRRGIEYCIAQGYKNISTLVDNTNIVMIKFAFKMGFKIIGIRYFDGKILCELTKREV